jgi:hypothetical protein
MNNENRNYLIKLQDYENKLNKNHSKLNDNNWIKMIFNNFYNKFNNKIIVLKLH